MQSANPCALARPAQPPMRPYQLGWAIVVASLLGAFTVYYQVNHMRNQGGLAWYEEVQWERTQQVMRGEQGTPWQYRLFTDSIVYAAVKAFEAAGLPRPVGTAFVLIRLVQNILLFCLAMTWCRRLGAPIEAAALGIWLLACGMCHGLYDTDMTFNTYSDMSIFLIAALLIQSGRLGWLLVLMPMAALNRETSGCIPFMLLFAHLRLHPKPHAPPRVLWTAAACLGIWILIVGGMRLPFVFGMRPYIVPTAGEKPILPLLMYNLTWYRTWVFLFATLGLLPFMALASWKRWPPILHRFFWAVVPAWFPAHFALAHAPETRLFLVPQILVFMPGAILGIRYWMSKRIPGAR